MKISITLTALFLFFVVHTPIPADAAWSEPKEIVIGTWGKGVGQFGLRSEGGYDVVPSIEAVTADKKIIVSDPVNRKQLVFSTEGKFLHELKWDDPKGQMGKSVAPLSQRGRMAQIVRSMQTGSGTSQVTIVFSDKNVVVNSDQDFGQAVRDASGFVYGIGAGQVARFDKNGKQTASLGLPEAHEELAAVPGSAPRAVYINYGVPVVAPNGDVYVWKRSGEKFSILKFTWQE
jgi:hypothetical protein